MRAGDHITLTQVGTANKVSGTVEGFKAGAMQLTTDAIPDWLQLVYRKRGMFYGPGTTVRFFMFLDHKGDWTDFQTLLHFSVDNEQPPC